MYMRVFIGGIYPLLFMLGMVFEAKGDDVAVIQDQHPVAGDYVPLHCRNFTIGDWRHREFYSPQYPGHYPNKTECIQLLVAPKGYRIRLDFREDFHIEKSEDCRYDFLEFRDGPFGYSPLLGKYCGKRHPPLMESSSRFLWVRFQSDDSIEYKGFRAVYDFYKPHISELNKTNNYNLCRVDVDMSRHEAFIEPKDIPETFIERANRTGNPIDCTWVIYIPEKHRISFQWRGYEMTTPQVCDDSFLEAYERTTAVSNRLKRICGGIAKDFKTSSNHVYIRIFANDYKRVPSFKALLTVFVHGPCEHLFDCGDDTCINRSLQCNEIDNCNYSWDEMSCAKNSEPASTQGSMPFLTEYHTIILGVVGGAIFTVIFFAVCITCTQRRREEERRRNVLKQEERQAIEIEMTNLLNRASPQGTPRRHVMAEAANPNSHIGNHVGAIPRVNANHVPNGQSNTHTPRRSNSYHSDRRNSRKYSYGNNRSGHTSDDELYDHSVDGATFRRFLDVSGYNDEDSSPNPSTHNQIPALVTVERPPASPGRPPASPGRRHSCDDMLGAVGRDKSPSPRPDVVQEEKFVYPDVYSHSRGGREGRRLSADTVRSDKSDVWKPIPPAETLPRTSSAKQHRRQHSFGRASDIHNAGPTLPTPPASLSFAHNQTRTPQKHDYSLAGASGPVERTSRGRATSTEKGADSKAYNSRTSPVIPKTSRAQQPQVPQPIYHLDNVNDTRPKSGRESPRGRKIKKPPPPLRTVTAFPPTANRPTKSSTNKAPDIFYTRPNPSSRSSSASRHQQV